MIEKKEIFSLGENKPTTDYEVVLDLGNHPWCNDFLKKEKCGKEAEYPLQLVYCNKPGLLQLSYFVPKETMFSDHCYLSGVTNSLTKHFYDVAEENMTQFNIKDNDLIVDIGGNDGSQLLQYKKLGANNVLNIESSDRVSKISKENGIKTINEFFNKRCVKNNIGEKTVKLYNASGVFFHLEELHSVIEGIELSLQDDGVLIVQFMYAGTMIEKLNFDTIYHEHLCYYTLKSLNTLLSKYNLEIFDAYYSEIHSGSIISKICKKDSSLNSKTDRFIELLENDKKYDLDKFKQFAKIIKSKKSHLKDILTQLKSKGNKIYAYGAPAKGNTLLNYFEIDNKLVDKSVEINELKIGKYLPKSHIPILKEDSDDLPDYYLLLAHNFEKEIIEKNQHIIDKGTKFIIPFPEVKIIG